MTEIAADGQALDTGKTRDAMTVWRGVHAKSRADGIENIKTLNGIHFYVIADAYRAAREEDPEWPRGSDAQWSRDSGVHETQAFTLSRLWTKENCNALQFQNWAKARDAAYGTATAATVDGNLNTFKFRTWTEARAASRCAIASMGKRGRYERVHKLGSSAAPRSRRCITDNLT